LEWTTEVAMVQAVYADYDTFLLFRSLHTLCLNLSDAKIQSHLNIA